MHNPLKRAMLWWSTDKLLNLNAALTCELIGLSHHKGGIPAHLMACGMRLTHFRCGSVVIMVRASRCVGTVVLG